MAYQDPTRCPSDETIACLLDQGLDEDSRNAVLAHAADCAACRFVLAEAVRAPTLQLERPAAPASARAIALAASLVVATGVTWLGIASRGPSVEDVFAAAGPHRQIAARLSGAPYQPPAPTYRDFGDRNPSSPAAWDLAAEARQARAAVDRRRSVTALQALGAAHLALGNHGEAIALFEELADRRGADLEHQVDLAAALLVRGVHDEEPVDVVRAHERLAKALGRSPADPAALFNRALALERLALAGQAARAWEDYLAVDAASGWAGEARAGLERLRQAQVEAAAEAGGEGGAAPPEGDRERLARWAAAHPGAAARWLRSRLLGEWASEWQAGRHAAAEEALGRGRVVAAAIAERTGDRSLLETLDAVLGDRRRRDALASAHAAYGRAWHALDEVSAEQAAEGFAATEGSLALLGRAETEWHSVGTLAAAVYSDGDAKGTRDALTTTLAAARQPLVRAHLLWLRGMLSGRQGANDAAVSDLAAAAEILRDAGDTDDAAWLRFLESEALQLAGDVTGGWRARVESLHLGRRSPRLGTSLLGAASFASLEGAPATALAYHEEAVLLDQIRPGGEVAEAWLWRAHILHQAGQPDRAREALGAAGSMVAAVAALDPMLGKTFRARHALTRALIGAGRPEDDLELVDQALGPIQRHLPVYTALLRQRRAELLLATGRARPARDELEAVLERAARLRLEPARELWSDGRNIGREALDSALRLDTEVFADPRSALRALLTYRAAGTDGQAPGDPLARLRQSLGAGEVAVVYAEVGQHLLVWRVDRATAAWARLPLPAGGLAGAIAEWIPFLGERQGDEAGKRLSRLLLPFWLDQDLPARLRIVPDESLAGLPWAALPAPAGGGQLVAKTELTLSPFAFTRPEPSGRPQGMLVVADARAKRELAPLAGARGEAAWLRSVFADTTVLVGDQAQRDRVLEALPRAGIAHFATHAWAHPRLPALARLSFAPGADGRSWLQAHEIPGLELDRTALVVLAGCSTARAAGSNATAMHGLAQGFISAGVPRVLGTLWPVEDDSTERLFRAFYGGIAVGQSPEAALRAAQLELSAAGVAPRHWSGFILLRG